MRASDIIRIKRDGGALSPAQMQAFVSGLTDGSWNDAQVAAMAMAVFTRGMDTAETTLLTQCMSHSGDIMQWSQAQLPGPVLDKHSTGGVGDKVSLMLAPIVAACGGYVPMISGRALGHTGGTLDKLSCIPGYQALPEPALLASTLQRCGCVIMGATRALAPADKRLYAIRDGTATIESYPLITASILSKKLAAGLQGLVLDIKVGNGAFAPTLATARALARSLVEVACGAGLRTQAWLTDMNQVLGYTCGNGLELTEAIEFLRCEHQEPRLLEVTRTLAAQMLCLGGLATSMNTALEKVDAALRSGRALERFEAMVAALGGPADLTDNMDAYLPKAPVVVPIAAPHGAWIAGMDTRAIGLAVMELGGGRETPQDTIDTRVGFSACIGIGQRVDPGQPLAWVHAASRDAADAATRTYLSALRLDATAQESAPVLLECIST